MWKIHIDALQFGVKSVKYHEWSQVSETEFEIPFMLLSIILKSLTKYSLVSLFYVDSKYHVTSFNSANLHYVTKNKRSYCAVTSYYVAN